MERCHYLKKKIRNWLHKSRKVKKSKKQLHTNKLDNLHERAKFLKKRQITKSDSRIGRK